MKKTVLIMALAAFLLVLVACGDKQANQQSAAVGEKTEANSTDADTSSETDPLDAEYAEGAKGIPTQRRHLSPHSDRFDLLFESH